MKPETCYHKLTKRLQYSTVPPAPVTDGGGGLACHQNNLQASILDAIFKRGIGDLIMDLACIEANLVSS